jgi:uncharacterized linocin/CFP29 family protein
MADLNWTDAQWQKVNHCVKEAFDKASVASAFLPCYGPLQGSTETVRNERLVYDDAAQPRVVRLDTDHDSVNLKLVNLTVNVQLSSEQVAEEALSNAMLAFRRAANILAQEEDRIVFEGFARGFGRDNSIYVANTVPPQKGLADLAARRDFTLLRDKTGALVTPATERALVGQAIVSAVVSAIHALEDRMHPEPFACVLGNELFERAHDPSESLVLPADRITPLLRGGPLLRAGRMDDRSGIVVSLAGNAVDIVVGTPPTIQFLQRTTEARFLFRVYERFVLRIRDAFDQLPVAGFRVQPDPIQDDQERAVLDARRP